MRAAAFLLVPFAVVATAAGAQNPATDPAPVITGVRQNPYTVTSDLGSKRMDIEGRNFWPSGPNVNSRWKIFMRKDGGAWSEFKSIAGNNTGESFEFPSLPWLQKAGRLEVRLSRDGVMSNTFAVDVKVQPPTLTGIAPAQIAWSANTADDRVYSTVLRGRYWIRPTTLIIDGVPQPKQITWEPNGEYILILPASARKAGRHEIQMQTEHGKSGIQYLEIVAPPTSVTALVPRIASKDIRAAGTTLNVRVRFAGSPPAEAAWRSDRATGWHVLPFGLNIRNDEADIDIPVAQLAGGVNWIEVRLKNIAGEGTARVIVDQTVLAGAVTPPKLGTAANEASNARAPGTVIQPPPVTVPTGTPARPGARPAVTPGGARPAVATPPGAKPAVSTPAGGTPAVAAPAIAQPAVVQPTLAQPTLAQPSVARPGAAASPATAATPAPAVASPAARPIVGAIAAPGARTPIDTYRANLQRRLGADASRVTATMQGSTLVLSGTVRTEAAKQSAAQAASGVAGVGAVRNDIRVAP